MILETVPSELEGKVVGREGVEPSTKRLRAVCPSSKYTGKTRVSPLSDKLVSSPKEASFRTPLRDQLAQPALLSDRIQPLRRPTLRLKQRGRIDRECLIGLGIVLLIFAGAAALYWAPQPAPPALNRCPTHEASNPWCGR